jgi:hypothetical protein
MGFIEGVLLVQAYRFKVKGLYDIIMMYFSSRSNDGVSQAHLCQSICSISDDGLS